MGIILKQSFVNKDTFKLSTALVELKLATEEKRYRISGSFFQLPARFLILTGVQHRLFDRLYPILEYPLKYFINFIYKYTQPNFHRQFKWWHKLNGNPVTETEYANHWHIKFKKAYRCNCWGSNRNHGSDHRNSRKRNGALQSSLESQPPLARKPAPVILTPDPFTLKYLESRRDVDIFEQGSSTTKINSLLSDGKIDELMRRMRTLETLLAAQSPGPQRSLPTVTPLPPNYTNDSSGRV
ncbi:hypothetical protein C8J55DRAFT_493067 [Lentinula edodes]|uniref:Uncharacterized protein n=1 Tax=Lentinula lateritia TaxID=40482 RepID=A0A9W9DF24_9AGAR|nr:hypothetical protein C8J55DRAFT_493067 [Lentinula edodes]